MFAQTEEVAAGVISKMHQLGSTPGPSSTGGAGGNSDTALSLSPTGGPADGQPPDVLESLVITLPSAGGAGLTSTTKNLASASRHLGSAPAPDSAGGAGQFSTATPRPSYTDHHEGGTRGSFESNRVMHGDSPAQSESTHRDFLGGATKTSSAGGAGNISNTDFPPSPAP